MAYTKRAPLWDDEIERLTQAAAKIHGAPVVADSLVQVVRRLVSSRPHPPLSRFNVRAAMMRELERLVRPN